MQVKLIAVTKPLIPECQEAEDLIAYCGRVSNPVNQANNETAPKLLGYLARNHHWSPFEMCSATIEIVTTRDIARQILRHRSFSFQEFSQRYAEVVAPAVPREARLQDAKNRQASNETDDEELKKWWSVEQDYIAAITQNTYEIALQRGIAKEVARAVLPEGMTESRLYMAGTIRSWIHYVQLRSGNGTQKEHQEIARACGQLLGTAMPSIKEFLS